MSIEVDLGAQFLLVLSAPYSQESLEVLIFVGSA